MLYAGPNYLNEIESSNGELIVFTHNDLDAIGSIMNVEFKFPKHKKKFFFTNYANISERVQEIEDHIKQNGNSYILIPDVSFSDNKDALRKLYSLGKCTHIDHHLYPEGFWDEFPEMAVVWDKSKCATKLCNEYLGNKGKNNNLDKFTFVTDVYDLWQTKSPVFNIAQDLNEYFWHNDLMTLFNTIVQNDYNLPSDYSSVIDGIHKAINTALKDYEDRKLIHRGGEITIAFVNEYFNQILLKEMAQGQNFVVGINSFGIVRVRIKEEAPYSSEQKDLLRLELTGTKDIGHQNAFTYKMKAVPTFATIMDEIQKVATTIVEVCSKK